MNDMIMQTVLWLTAGGLLVMLMMIVVGWIRQR